MEYVKSVRRWGVFQDNLDDQNSHKIDAANRGIVLLSHLYGLARDLFQGIGDDLIESQNGTELIVYEIYRSDPLSMVYTVYQEPETLFTRRNENDS